MTFRKAVVDKITGKVENVIEADDTFAVEGKLLVEDLDHKIDIGMQMFGDEFSYPEAEVKRRRGVQVSKEIKALEEQQTDRRVREAALSDEGKQWLSDLDDKIKSLRAEMGK